MALDVEHDNGKTGGTPALPGVPPAIRTEWQKAASLQAEFEADDSDLNDISAIINGNKSITGKAVYSANQAVRNADHTEAQKADQKKREADVQEARELMHLAEWNGQMTNVGGVEMTNEQAQEARQHVIDNEDYYAHRAVKDGRIRSSEEDDYKFNTRRIKELKDREGRGIATADEQRECERRQNSKVGQASEHDAGEYSAQHYGQKVEASKTSAQDFSKMNGNAAASVYGDSFKETPKPTESFNRHANALASEEKIAEITPIPSSPKVAAQGFGV